MEKSSPSIYRDVHDLPDSLFTGNLRGRFPEVLGQSVIDGPHGSSKSLCVLFCGVYCAVLLFAANHSTDKTIPVQKFFTFFVCH